MSLHHVKIYGIGIALLCLFLLSPATQLAYADGGAPNLAYVAGAGNGMSVIDISQQKVVNNFAVPGDPSMVYLSLDGRFLYIAQPALGRVTLLAAKTGQTVCTANVPGRPSLVAFDAGLNILYAAGNASNTITEIDPTNCAIKKTITTSGDVYGMAVAYVGSGISGGNGNQLWVATTTAMNVYTNSNLIASIPIPGGPQYVTIPAGEFVYLTTRNGDVYAIDLASRKPLPALLSGGQFGPMDYDAITGEVYVPDIQHKVIEVLSPITPGTTVPPHEPINTIRLGVAPQSIAITSDGQLGFIALQGGNVAMLDIPGKQIFNTIHVGGEPHFIITGLYPPAIGNSSPQQAQRLSTIIAIGAYALVIALIVIPLFLLWRYMRSSAHKKDLMRKQ
ncbi:MAG TPA: YncE family protein [Ktedonobacteraceae bacterium]|nr:YncE family protein [Ktedonobacteraceae bacterium]